MQFIELNTNLYRVLDQLVQQDSLNKQFRYTGILDVFSYCLSEDEAKTLIHPYEYHLKHEYKFINLFKSLFEENASSTCFVHLGNSIEELRKINHGLLNQNELKELNYVTNRGSRIIQIEDINEIELFLKLSTREIHFCDYIFNYGELMVRGNFDLSFPIYYKEKEYLTIIEKNNLYVR
ncbi:hypothetical protein SAMN04487895_10811 [Paenibacillus sophorae]|uniref:Uncharacterized protein n=1 Tax=Paenibacillus sophorae TaxID=1333845 RepID=A0A1H8Q0Z4_9BACL|nr:hypothetical protein [Paenibacillus sophorae]QWU15325.1 hypothetical protein KP014_26155 [Paenibacillus sophorae]SEO47453.1 hypothetical protein SAMN04487895_10811 [Paenibacillus sophorae]